MKVQLRNHSHFHVHISPQNIDHMWIYLYYICSSSFWMIWSSFSWYIWFQRALSCIEPQGSKELPAMTSFFLSILSSLPSRPWPAWRCGPRRSFFLKAGSLKWIIYKFTRFAVHLTHKPIWQETSSSAVWTGIQRLPTPLAGDHKTPFTSSDEVTCWATAVIGLIIVLLRSKSRWSQQSKSVEKCVWWVGNGWNRPYRPNSDARTYFSITSTKEGYIYIY